MLAFVHRPVQKFPYNISSLETYRAPEIQVYNRIYLDNPFAADLWSAACTVRIIDLVP